MADYKRMVSYLYKYKNGVKGENVGYVRVERMNGEVKFVVRMRDQQGPEGIPMQVCMYRKQEGQGLIGFPCGCMELIHGEGEFKGQTQSNNICGGNRTFEDMNGMVIYYNEEMAYGTQWDAVPLDMNQFSCMKENSEGKKQCQKPDGRNPEDTMNRPNGSGNQSSLIQPRQMPQSREMPEMRQSEQMPGTGQLTEPRQMPGISQPEQMLDTERTVDPREIQSTRETKQNQEEYVDDLLDTLDQQPNQNWNQNWNQNQQEWNQQQNQNMSQNQDQRELEEAERGPNTQPLWGNQPHTEQMSFQQIDKIIQNNPRLPNMEGSIIGIPGVYSRENEYLAALFGFKEFLPLRGMPIRSGTYGYWIRPLQA